MAETKHHRAEPIAAEPIAAEPIAAEPAETADLVLVRSLAQVLTQSDLNEIEFEKGGLRIRLTRQAPALAAAAPAALPPPLSPLPAAAAGETSDEQALLAHPGLLTSPMVGVVYTSPEPDTPPFVRVGDPVKAGDPVLLIEAMKVFNAIAAPRPGRIRHIFVGNGQPVEYGEPLLIIE